MAYDLETEPEYTKQIRCSDCNNWKQVNADVMEYMEINEIPDTEFICAKCRKQEHLI